MDASAAFPLSLSDIRYIRIRKLHETAKMHHFWKES